VAAFGFWVETVEHKCEGLVSINSLLEFDDFRHIETDYALVGRRSGKQFRMGDKITIKIVAASLAKRQLDYEWVIAIAEKEERASRPEDPEQLAGEGQGQPAGRQVRDNREGHDKRGRDGRPAYGQEKKHKGKKNRKKKK
jgi:ribonuclease R